MSRNNVTMIDDLPYLDDIERKSYMTGVPSSEMKQVSKFIRDTTYNPPFESGMAYNQVQQQQQQIQQQIQLPPPPPPQPIEGFQHNQEHMKQENFHRILSLSCVDVAEHASNCIVCSRLYNNDMTLYIIVITILLLTIVILIKKVLDCPSR